MAKAPIWTPSSDACAEYGVAVIEDAAEAVGTLYKGKPAGTLGDVGVYSFNGNKIITTTGGGMLVSRNPAWVEKARFWSQQARDPGLAYEHSELGYNYRMSNVLAGIGRGQLEVLDLRVQQRRAIAFRYRDAFADLPGISLMPQAPYGLHTNWLSCFLIEEETVRLLPRRAHPRARRRQRGIPPRLEAHAPAAPVCRMRTLRRRGGRGPVPPRNLPPQLQQPLSRRPALRRQPGPRRSRRWATLGTPTGTRQRSSEESVAMSRFDIQHVARHLTHHPRWVMRAVQLAIFAVAGVFAFLLRFDFTVPVPYLPHLLAALCVCCSGQNLRLLFLQIGSRMVAICFHSRCRPPRGGEPRRIRPRLSRSPVVRPPGFPALHLFPGFHALFLA